MTTIPAFTSRNPSWGFYVTVCEQHGDVAWDLAMREVGMATGQDADAVLAFLDSRHGRHFGDDVLSGLQRGIDLPTSIQTTTRRWMGWSIGRESSLRTGIPRGLPYLTSFVINSAIEADA